jgi:glycosyltransferase involved in cell wall biosynthesis
MLPKEKSDKCILIMHTTPVDNNGTDLYAVVDKICPDYRVELLGTKVEADLLNQLYNVADCTINIANNEGFGLTTAESIMAGTPIIVNVTGGLQDQCGFNYTAEDYITFESLHDKKTHGSTLHGEWVKPVWPSAININGSPLTPYIYDDRVNDYDVANAIFEFYDMGRDARKEKGLKGREWALNNLSSKIMCDALINGVETTFENFQPRKKYDLYKIV